MWFDDQLHMIAVFIASMLLIAWCFGQACLVIVR